MKLQKLALVAAVSLACIPMQSALAHSGTPAQIDAACVGINSTPLAGIDNCTACHDSSLGPNGRGNLTALGKTFTGSNFTDFCNPVTPAPAPSTTTPTPSAPAPSTTTPTPPSTGGSMGTGTGAGTGSSSGLPGSGRGSRGGSLSNRFGSRFGSSGRTSTGRSSGEMDDDGSEGSDD